MFQKLEKAGMVRFDLKANPWCTTGPNYSVKALDNYTGSLCFEMAWYQKLPFP